MKLLISRLLLVGLIGMPACGLELDFNDGFSGTPAQSRTAVLEGEWTLTLADLSGQYDNLIEFSDAGGIIHWYDQNGDDFYDDLAVVHTDISVSATNQVSLFLQYDYLFNGVLYSAEVSLSGVMFGDDNIMQLDGSTTLLEDGLVSEFESLSVYAVRGNSTENGGINDGALTDSLEGTWYFTMTDFIDTEINSIEFDNAGRVRHWINPYGVDITRLDADSSLYASVSSSYSVDLGAEYTFEYEGSTFSVLLEMSGNMSQTEDAMTLDGTAKVYSDGYLVSMLHTSVTANRSAFSAGSVGNENFAYLEGEWTVVTHWYNDFGLFFQDATCDVNGDVTHWYLSDGVDILANYSTASASINVSNSNQAYVEMYYEGLDPWGNFASTSKAYSGVFNGVNKSFMQLVGEETYITGGDTFIFPTLTSLYRVSQAATSANGNIWPINAIIAQLADAGYGPLYSPWARS